MMGRLFFVGLFAAMACVPAGAQAQESSPAMSSADRSIVKTSIRDFADSLAPSRNLPYFGATSACDGASSLGITGNLTSGIVSPATWPSLTATMAVAVKMSPKDKIQIKSTIQCSTDGDTSIASAIAVVDKNGSVFFADPDPAGSFYFSCSPGHVYQQHTGLWWFDGRANPGFAGGVTTIIRGDSNFPNSGGSIDFRTLCVDKVK